MVQAPKKEIKDRGVMGRGHAGADSPGGATMATTSKFQPPGIGEQAEQKVPKKLLSPFGLRNY